jgi:hypothetical protein
MRTIGWTKSMHSEAHLDAETTERLEEQSGLLLRIYQAEFAKRSH